MQTCGARDVVERDSDKVLRLRLVRHVVHGTIPVAA